MIPVLWIGGASFACTLAFIALLQPIACRVNLVDRPDGRRKLHGRATPLVGGLGVFCGAAAALCAIWLGWMPGASLAADSNAFLAAMLCASLALLAIGVLDDRFGLRGRHKLTGQVAVIGLLLSTGLAVHSVVLFGWRVELGLLAVPFTLFWMLGAVNSLNLVDGLDGLAGTIGVFQSAGLATLALLMGQDTEAALAIALCGALLAFLCFNLPPARVFMGDAGSTLVGLLTGVLALRIATTSNGTLHLAIPLAIWAVPAFDTAAAILRRKLTGRSLYTTDRGHLHHCLLARLGSVHKVLAAVAICCALTVAAALTSHYSGSDYPAIWGILLVAAVLIATRTFGYAEFLLLASQAKNLLRSLVHLGNANKQRRVEASVQLQGSRQWNLLWESLTEFADKLNLVSVHLNVNLPAVQEGFHATWRRPSQHNPDDLWRTELPLFSGEQAIGRLTVAGERDGASACELIERLMDLLRPYESQLLQLAQGPALQPAQAWTAPRTAARVALHTVFGGE